MPLLCIRVRAGRVSVLVLDNARTQRSDEVIDAIRAAGCRLILPPYSPDLNHIIILSYEYFPQNETGIVLIMNDN